MLKEAGHIPAVKDVSPAKGTPLSFFAQQALVGTPLPAGPEMREVWTPMDRVIEEVFSGAKSPEKALSDAQALIRAKVEEVKKQ
jgi:maltose-binding protein MalE